MEEQTTKKRPAFITVLAVLSFIGSGLWALFSLIGIVASAWIMSLLGPMFSGVTQQGADALTSMEGMEGMEGMEDFMSQVDTEQLDQAANAVTDVASSISTYFTVGCIVSFLLAALSIFGVVKMMKLKKSGFWMYTIANVIVLGLLVYVASWFSAIVTLAFIVMYGLNLKHMS